MKRALILALLLSACDCGGGPGEVRRQYGTSAPVELPPMLCDPCPGATKQSPLWSCNVCLWNQPTQETICGRWYSYSAGWPAVCDAHEGTDTRRELECQNGGRGPDWHEAGCALSFPWPEPLPTLACEQDAARWRAFVAAGCQ